MTAHAIGAYSQAAIRANGWGNPFIMGTLDAGRHAAYQRHDSFIRRNVPPYHQRAAYAYDRMQIEDFWGA